MDNADKREGYKMDWRSLLGLAIAFILGWAANGAITGSQPSQRGLQPGIGGGPGTVQTASPSATVLPSLEPTFQPSPELSATPTPLPSP